MNGWINPRDVFYECTLDPLPRSLLTSRCRRSECWSPIRSSRWLPTKRSTVLVDPARLHPGR